MNTPARYILLVLGIIVSISYSLNSSAFDAVIQISFHYILSFTHAEYGQATSISTITSKLKGDAPSAVKPVPDDYYSIPSGTSNSSLSPQVGTANAAFVILARNSDIDGAMRSIRDVEDRFNHKYHYPYVFLNDEPFNDDFKKCVFPLCRQSAANPRSRRISNLVSGKIEFGVIPKEDWYQPDWIDENKAAAGRKKMEENNVIYGGAAYHPLLLYLI